MLALYFAILALGLILLYQGAIKMLDSTVYIAEKAGIPKFIIGVTVIAVGTSIPELIINIFSSVQGNSHLTIGDIIGSNISNILVVIGLSAIYIPIKVKKLVATRDIPFAITSILIFAVLVLDTLFGGLDHNELSRGDGIILLIVFFIFIYYVAFSHREHFGEVASDYIRHKIVKKFALMIFGLALLVGGGLLVVENAVLIAEHFGLAEKVIGLTIVALGTSLPELVTIIVALKKGESEIGVGNIIGSNIVNILFILGASVTINPILYIPSIRWDLFILTVATMLLLISLYTGKRNKIDRVEGIFFVVIYLIYITSLFITAT
jgi:cation:H+ antiporter